MNRHDPHATRASANPAGVAMDPVGNLKAYVAAIFSVLAICVLLTAATTYISLRSHLQEQQQREIQRSRDFHQLSNELVQPLQLSKWMSRDAFLLDWLRKGERDPGQALDYLKAIAAQWQVSAFVASNLTRTYYFSDGTSKPLTRETPDVDWFFQLLEHKVETLADVGYDNGNLAKPFLYIDVRMPDIDGKPSAYVGAAVQLQRFLDLLIAYKRTHGEELHFVNQEGMVILSSTPEIVNTPAEQYGWYHSMEKLPHEHGTRREKSISFETSHFSISREWIQELGWHVYTERDLRTSQSAVYTIILKTIGLITLLIMLALTAMTVLLHRLRRDLQKAFAQIRTLKGIVPICCSCKKIRDDQGYWQQLEQYLQEHSEADLSHGICPECARKMYPGLKLEGLEGFGPPGKED